MAESFPGFNAPTAGFDQPLEMLSGCHDKLRQRCETLGRLPRHIAQYGADEQARGAAQNILRYFDGPALHHHADEENDLFPALLESVAGSDAVCLNELFERLSAEHRSLENHWQRLRPLLREISQGQPADLPITLVQAFINGYAAHLHCEDNELLPTARRMLGNAALAHIGAAMHQRRNP
ncbi:MAG TPA: hemerythrin domain-containing protein [Pusillimonas sp.]|uniref:hemerythrin domain-containing protein n=1 Tax=Pusillimonas sp. TaxID=3040095 RepID=UPI002B84D502|nr:hemerythrin domain-containing protein [Pusillimonas sp.]HUH87252.1 hemerythrin domain-containing protein [Pusillimonas sp.]